ncbi:hypothetical protein LB505_013668 [Fusarium chuoi]|nr:hypothetical protein LB505_013668 [Fusarium chuoi]
MLTFGLGGTLLGVSDEDPVDAMDANLRDRAGHNDTPDESGSDEENGESNERTSLLPGPLPRYAKKASRARCMGQAASSHSARAGSHDSIHQPSVCRRHHRCHSRLYASSQEGLLCRQRGWRCLQRLVDCQPQEHWRTLRHPAGHCRWHQARS